MPRTSKPSTGWPTAVARRGPDGRGAWSLDRVALAHRRLKVIDLSDRAAQPLVDADLGLVVAFNGCIYNHRELRRELEADGLRFFSTSDTEVIAKAWHRWGEACVDRFAGMFAFAVAERDTGRVALVRDRLGIKPLYLAEADGALRFASTLPALAGRRRGRHEPGPRRAAPLLQLARRGARAAHRPNGVRKLPPATVLVVEADGRRRSTRYWAPGYGRRPQDAGMAPEDWTTAVREALRTAVRRRMVADVPVGVLLSGGLDSSLIVGLLAEEGQSDLATFSIGFDAGGDREGDEFAYSDQVVAAFGTDHHRWRVGRHEVVDALGGAIGAMSEPMVSHDAVAFYLLSEEVARSLKVVQSGQGADEVFAGYSWYPPLRTPRGSGTTRTAPPSSTARTRTSRPCWARATGPRRTSAAPSSTSTSRAPGPTSRSTGRSGWTRRSCWSTTPSSAWTT